MLSALRWCLCCCLFPLVLIAQGDVSDETPVSSAATIIEKYPERVTSLLAALNLDYPGLDTAKQAYENGDFPQAVEAVIAYYRTKKVSQSLEPDLPPARKDILELAEDATRDIFTIQSRTYRQPRLSDGRIDWENLGPNKDKEWAWMMNRHQHFDYLLAAYLHTRNEKYLHTINDHLIDWIPTHPAPQKVTFSTSWRALEAARRIMDTWLAVFVYARAEPAISDEALFLLLTSIPEHANALRNHDSFWGGNHKITEKTAVVVCALAWPEFREALGWLERAVQKIGDELYKQTYPDGSYKELANHYQKVVGENYLWLVRILRGNNAVASSPKLEKRVEEMWNYFAYVTRPSGFGPLNNDSSLEDNFTILEEANRFFNRPDWTYILSYGEKGTEPQEPPSRYFPWAGQAILRSGWDRSAHWAFFDVGPNGSAHQHDDKLHLSISIGQNDLLVDSGRYIYKPGPVRDYFRSGVGHNVVRVDGQDSIRPPNTVNSPVENQVSITSDYDLVQGKVGFNANPMTGQSVEQIRTVVYFREIGWLVIDELLGYGGHQYDTNWNFHPDCAVTRQQDDLSILLPDDSTARLTLLGKNPGKWDLVRGQKEPEVRGWYSWAYNERKPTTSARYTYFAAKPHYNAWWITPESPITQELNIQIEGEADDLYRSKIVLQTRKTRFEVSRDKTGTMAVVETEATE